MPNQSKKHPACIVLERNGAIALSIRPYLCKWLMVETRSWDACLREMRDRPGSFVCFSVTTSNLHDMANHIQYVRDHGPQSLLIAAVDPSFAVAADVLREIGCSYVFTSVLQLRNVGKIANRHLSAQPSPRATLVEKLWQRLPWQSAT